MAPAVQDDASHTEADVPEVPVGEDPAVEDHENWADEAGITALDNVDAKPSDVDTQVVESPVSDADDDKWTEEDWYNHYTFSPPNPAVVEPLDIVGTAHGVVHAARDAVISPYQVSRILCLTSDIGGDLSMLGRHPAIVSLAENYCQIQRSRLGAEPRNVGRSILHQMASGLRAASRSLDSAAQLINHMAGSDVEIGGAARQRR
jgi:hypothetical protein